LGGGGGGGWGVGGGERIKHGGKRKERYVEGSRDEAVTKIAACCPRRRGENIGRKKGGTEEVVIRKGEKWVCRHKGSGKNGPFGVTCVKKG